MKRDGLMGIGTLLLNTLIILICILSYQVFWLDREEKKRKNELLISLLASFAVVLCMTFPFNSYSGYIYDLRIIPIILCFLYGGIRSFLFVGVIYLAYRYYLNPVGFYNSAIIFSILSLIVYGFYIFAPILLRKRKKLASMFLLVTYILIIFIIDIVHKQGLVSAKLLLIHFIINLFTMGISLYLIEGMLEKKRLKEKIQRTEKLFVLGELSAAFAHEIGNPLTTVRGFLQFMMNNPISDIKKQNEYFQLMMTELTHAESILAEYLSLKSQEDIKETLDFGQLIQEVIEISSPLATKNLVQIQSKLQSFIMIEANPLRVKKCLIEIIENGIEAMKTGGILTITLKQERKEIVIDITDTGVGMTKEEIKRLGMPFYSLKEKGTGLGTIVAFSIIKELKGDVEIRSKKGEGTCFSILIPIVK
ncbi:ATP-binding protein [Metabacillus fastidiosus]|uniref:ATP-binding protein n=1 Tax=Metabacillus fastidiosus TaxID=1458 RepID=UPI002E1D0C94|nr:ATP-binding protein [Metabacillus fastidiosus]